MDFANKPCEQDKNWDYSFYVTYNWEDPETWDWLFEISWNPNCEICLFSVECAQKVIDIFSIQEQAERSEYAIDEKNFN